MQYGYFDDAQREYVITDPRTPVKWINYIGTLAFGGFVDHTGGALLCKGDPALNRITRYLAQMPASDFKGSTLYVRLHTPQGYALFSPFYVPCLQPYEQYTCRVGLGYTRIVSRVMGIEVDVTIFVPRGAPCEVRDIRVTNCRDQAVTLDLIPVVEYTHFDALKQLTNADWVPQTMQSSAHPQPGGRLVLTQCAFMKRGSGVNYFTSSAPVDSFETDRRLFLGANEYGTWANPLSLQAEHLMGSQAQRGDNIAALLHALGELQPGETRQVITLLGQEADLQSAAPVIAQFGQPAAVAGALAELGRFWQTYLEVIQVHTPDADFDRMLNTHNPRQCYITQTWSRYLSLYQLGYGARGIGFRDSSQDVMGVLASAPAEARALLGKLLAVQRRDGSAMHQFNPLTMVASVGDAQERSEDRPQYYSDDALWAVLAATAYLKETGDWAFLEEIIPFYEKDADEQPLEQASVLEHLRRALAFTRGDRGAHGLALLGFADWNDTINLARGAESLLSTHLYGRALLEMAALCDFRGEAGDARIYREEHAALSQVVNDCAWDGGWYRAYFDADGTPLGSQQNAAGQIYAYAQAWPVLAQFAPSERARQALEAVAQRLNTTNGIKLSTPGFNGFDPRVGGITTYPPGAKENGGIFLHVNPWVIIAETMQGNGARAYRYYRQINPAVRNEHMEVFECEPYVYPQNILGDEHPLFGLARNSWLSGTASWMYQAGIQYLLGVRPEYDGLWVDPCIPPDWDGFTMRRIFRGALYEIEVRNPQHVSRGVVRLEVDGMECTGCVPAFPAGSQHRVVAILGLQN